MLKTCSMDAGFRINPKERIILKYREEVSRGNVPPIQVYLYLIFSIFEQLGIRYFDSYISLLIVSFHIELSVALP